MMRWSTIERRWSEYTANVKLRWSRLSLQEIEDTLGERDTLSIRVQLAYAISKPAADNQISEWQTRQMEDQIPVGPPGASGR